MGRFIALFPFLFSIATLVLAFLCLFAGYTRTFMQDTQILTLNTSMIGYLSNTSSPIPYLNNLNPQIQSEVGDVAHDIAKDIGIHDFYSAFILDYCEGYYESSAIANATFHPKENVTGCSNHTALFHFNPYQIIQGELNAGINLTSDLDWPSNIQTEVNDLETAYKAMVVLYIIGIALSGLAFIGTFLGVLEGGRLSAMINFLICTLAFIALGCASAIATVIAVRVVRVINQYGNAIGIAAYRGNKFLALTWAATGVMLLATFLCVVQCCVGRNRRDRY